MKDILSISTAILLVILCVTCHPHGGFEKHKNKNKNKDKWCDQKPTLETLLMQTTYAKSFGRTQYGVCPKQHSQEEKDLILYLRELKTVGLKEYLDRKQKCGYQKQHTASANLLPTTNNYIVAHVYNEGEELKSYFPYGTNVIFEGCTSKGADDVNNTLSMCRVCKYSVFLPAGYYPQIHSHVTCHSNGDYSCFTGSGVCVMNNVVTPLLYDVNNVGLEQLADWREELVKFTKSCSCQIIKNDPLEVMV